jgi:hypothetical protein
MAYPGTVTFTSAARDIVGRISSKIEVAQVKDFGKSRSASRLQKFSFDTVLIEKHWPSQQPKEFAEPLVPRLHCPFLARKPGKPVEQFR